MKIGSFRAIFLDVMVAYQARRSVLLTALSMPRFKSTGFMSADTYLMPSQKEKLTLSASSR
jgi:hypothetical protein